MAAEIVDERATTLHCPRIATLLMLTPKMFYNHLVHKLRCA